LKSPAGRAWSSENCGRFELRSRRSDPETCPDSVFERAVILHDERCAAGRHPSANPDGMGVCGIIPLVATSGFGVVHAHECDLTPRPHNITPLLADCPPFALHPAQAVEIRRRPLPRTRHPSRTLTFYERNTIPPTRTVTRQESSQARGGKKNIT